MDKSEEEGPRRNTVRDKRGHCWKDFVGHIKSDLCSLWLLMGNGLRGKVELRWQ